MLCMGVVAMLSLSSCNGILAGIYDEPLPDNQVKFGFIEENTATNSGRIYIDATDYTNWCYIDLHNKQVINTLVGDKSPEQWDFAVHRYDTKTNQASVAETSYTSIDKVPTPTLLDNFTYTSDEWTNDKITIDMSQMMDGIILYAEDYYNTVLSSWLNVDTSIMPPIYTLSEKVYILKMSDNTYAALYLHDFINDSAIKGFMTIDYIYPLKVQ